MPKNSSFKVIDVSAEFSAETEYANHPIAAINDHVIRVSTMTKPYAWHYHPESDETFLQLEGAIAVDFDDCSVELQPGQMITVNKGVRHRTRPLYGRSVNLTVERADLTTVLLPPP